MMDQATAEQIAIDVIASHAEVMDGDSVIVTHIERMEEGWYIECNSRLFMQTDNPLYAVVTAPIMVHPDGTYRLVY